MRSLLQSLIPPRCRPALRRLYCALRSVWYVGARFTCPICNRRFRKFLPYGLKPRPNAKCPRCGSLERHRLLWLYLTDKTNILTHNLKVLDVAPPSCLWDNLRRQPNLSYVPADLSPRMPMTTMDITDIHLPDNHFHCIICYHVLEHVPDDAKAISELFRVLKPGGWAIIQSAVDPDREMTFEDPAVNSPQERQRVFGQADHVRIYGRDYKARLENAGFTVTISDYAAELGETAISKHSLPTTEPLYLCTKPAPLV